MVQAANRTKRFAFKQKRRRAVRLFVFLTDKSGFTEFCAGRGPQKRQGEHARAEQSQCRAAIGHAHPACSTNSNLAEIREAGWVANTNGQNRLAVGRDDSYKILAISESRCKTVGHIQVVQGGDRGSTARSADGSTDVHIENRVGEGASSQREADLAERHLAPAAGGFNASLTISWYRQGLA